MRIVPLLLLALTACSSNPSWNMQPAGVTSRLRGVSAASASVAWASGADGTVLRTTDGGHRWEKVTIADAATLDFRDVEAIGPNEAFVLAIGPGESSRIYRTSDGGRSWTEEFRNTDAQAFYDCMAFWNRDEAIAFSDPVGGVFPLLRRSSARWVLSDGPRAAGDVAAFAASGTCVATGPGGAAWIATGGDAGVVYRTSDRGATWSKAVTPIVAGGATRGIFSIAANGQNVIVVGGDYKKENEPGATAAWSDDGGETWHAAAQPPAAFRSAVAFLQHRGRAVAIAVGPSGSSISSDGGRTWREFSSEGFHAVAFSGKGGWAVGEKGRVARLIWR